MFGIDDALIGAGLSFGGKLLSGLGARQSAKSQQKHADAVAYMQNLNNSFLGVQVQNQAGAVQGQNQALISAWNPAKDAAKFGYNPVTWLQSGQASAALSAAIGNNWSGFDGWLKGEQLQLPTALETVNVPSALSAVGNAVSAGVSTYSDMSSTEAKAAASANLISAIQQARARGNPQAGLGVVPAFTSAGTLINGGGAAGALSIGAKEAAAITAEGFKVDRGTVTPTGYTPSVDLSYPDASTVEKRYGFFPAMVAGGYNLLADELRTPLQASPATNPGFGTRFAPNIANERIAPSFSLGGWTWNAPALGADQGEQVWSSAPPLFGY